MILTIKILILILLATIAIQDFKDRLVWWFLFPLFGLAGTYLFYESSLEDVFVINIVVNLILVTILLLSVLLYAKFKLKRKFLNDAFGLGDVLFLLAFSLCFPTFSFLNFLVFSVLFSLGVYYLILKSRGVKAVPFAGTMAIFLIGVFVSHWLGFINSMYLL